MTPSALAPSRPARFRPARFRPARFRPARALRLEIKHSPIAWVLPVLAVIFYYDTYRIATGLPPTWAYQSSIITGPMLVYICVFAAGLGAWVGTRDGRRKTGDLLATTSRAAWARQLTVLAATAFWLVLAFLAETAVVYIQAASAATWGGPPLWPVAVGVVCTVTACAVGFTGGTLFPGRFTAPIVAVAVFVLWFIGVKAANNVGESAYSGGDSTYALLLPNYGIPHNVEDGVFYHVLPDVSIAQVMFMGGLLLVMVGLLALSPAGGTGGRPPGMLAALRARYDGDFCHRARSAARVPGVRGLSFAAVGRRLAMVAGVLVVCGAAATVTAYSLVGTAQFSPATGDWAIPALHDAANDQPIPYTPDCTGTAFLVCIHPAFDGYLDAVSAALAPAVAEIAGLPGAPARAELAVDDALPAAAGTTSVYAYSGTGVSGSGTGVAGVGGSSFGGPPAEVINAIWTQGYQQSFLVWFVSGPLQNASGIPDPAQQAVSDALLAKIGAPSPQYGPPQTKGGAPATQSGTGGAQGQAQASPAQISAAANKFGSLSSAARHAWLAAHIAALRSGAITLAQIP